MAFNYLSAADGVRLARIMDRITDMLGGSRAEAIEVVEQFAATLAPDALAPARWAAQLLKMRSSRNELFDAPIFGELAWDMLLDLLVNEAEGRRVSVSSLTIASRGPPTTALRHLVRLIEHGLVTRSGDSADRRRSWVELTPMAREALVLLLDRLRAGVLAPGRDGA